MRGTSPETADLYRCAYCGEDGRYVPYGWLKCKLCRQPVCSRHMDDHLVMQHNVTDLFTVVSKKE